MSLLQSFAAGVVARVRASTSENLLLLSLLSARFATICLKAGVARSFEVAASCMHLWL